MGKWDAHWVVCDECDAETLVRDAILTEQAKCHACGKPLPIMPPSAPAPPTRAGARRITFGRILAGALGALCLFIAWIVVTDWENLKTAGIYGYKKGLEERAKVAAQEQPPSDLVTPQAG